MEQWMANREEFEQIISAIKRAQRRADSTGEAQSIHFLRLQKKYNSRSFDPEGDEGLETIQPAKKGFR